VTASVADPGREDAFNGCETRGASVLRFRPVLNSAVASRSASDPLVSSVDCPTGGRVRGSSCVGKNAGDRANEGSSRCGPGAALRVALPERGSPAIVPTGPFSSGLRPYQRLPSSRYGPGVAPSEPICNLRRHGAREDQRPRESALAAIAHRLATLSSRQPCELSEINAHGDPRDDHLSGNKPASGIRLQDPLPARQVQPRSVSQF
jgi:hypothetical protein